ncbi:wd40 repeat-containing protein [Stylonychia lemnae]|uniref:Wd40 repeat-containing protein n=1 Tax=Stylonychia lemnae TaxID=5949 RepID=A0A078AD31_STYLE|nr:wd40 repeat-containing protein [Stylonychia lemnae]|eukprot:CDW78768.1 wd40 repeat-containing protein [Stylonychia lemnae]
MKTQKERNSNSYGGSGSTLPQQAQQTNIAGGTLNNPKQNKINNQIQTASRNFQFSQMGYRNNTEYNNMNSLNSFDNSYPQRIQINQQQIQQQQVFPKHKNIDSYNQNPNLTYYHYQNVKSSQPTQGKNQSIGKNNQKSKQNSLDMSQQPQHFQPNSIQQTSQIHSNDTQSFTDNLMKTLNQKLKGLSNPKSNNIEGAIIEVDSKNSSPPLTHSNQSSKKTSPEMYQQNYLMQRILETFHNYNGTSNDLNQQHSLNSQIVNTSICSPITPITIISKQKQGMPQMKLQKLQIDLNVEEFKDDSQSSSEIQSALLERIDGLIKAEHSLIGKKVLIPRQTLKSHFDTVRDLKFCCDDKLLVSVSEDCMLKLWDIKQIRQTQPEDETMIEPFQNLRGHTGPLFSLTSNHGKTKDDTLLYSAGSEGVIRIWRIPNLQEQKYYPQSDGKNYCIGVFSSHKDVVWQLAYHPVDEQLLSVSADGSVKMWKSFDFKLNKNTNLRSSNTHVKNKQSMNQGEGGFESIEQCTNHCLMGSFLNKKENGVLEIPTSAAWINTNPNMLIISYRNPILGLFDRITVIFVCIMLQYRVVPEVSLMSNMMESKINKINSTIRQTKQLCTPI